MRKDKDFGWLSEIDTLYRTIRKEHTMKTYQDSYENAHTKTAWVDVMKGMGRTVYCLNWNEHCKDLTVDHADKLQREFIEALNRDLLRLHAETMKALRPDQTTPYLDNQESV